MAFFDIFKKKRKEKRAEKKPEKKVQAKPPEKEAAPKPQKTRMGASDTAYRILKEPHVSEKATDLTKKDWYAFRVSSRANKTETKRAVEELYGVNVVAVRIVNIPSKKRRLGRIEGRRKGYKKAIVQLRAGQKIEVLPR